MFLGDSVPYYASKTTRDNGRCATLQTEPSLMWKRDMGRPIMDQDTFDRKRESDIPMARAVNKSDEKLQTFVSEKGSSDEYLCRMAREDKDYQFLKEVIQNNLWKRHGKDQRIARFLGVASDLSIIGEFIL